MSRLNNNIALSFALVLVVLAGVARANADVEPSIQVYQWCNGNTYTSGSVFDKTLARAFNMLQGASYKSLYGSARVGPKGTTVTSMYQCRGDMPLSSCAQCVTLAIQSVQDGCPNNVGARVQLDGCYLRYENYAFFSLDTGITDEVCNGQLNGANKTAVYQNDVQKLVNRVIAAAPKKLSNGGYATAVAKTSDRKNTVYALAQCLGYLSASQCASCLSTYPQDWVNVCSGAAEGAQIHTSSCYYRFQTTPFFYS